MWLCLPIPRKGPFQNLAAIDFHRKSGERESDGDKGSNAKEEDSHGGAEHTEEGELRVRQGA